MNDHPDIFKEITTIVNWYGKQQKGFADIEKLLYTRQKLAGYAYNLAEIAGQFKAEHLRHEYSRKIAFAKVLEELSSLTDSNGKKQFTVDVCKSRAEQNADVQHHAAHEIEAEIASNRARLLLNQVNEILSALSQQVSYLKDEKRATSTGQN